MKKFIAFLTVLITIGSPITNDAEIIQKEDFKAEFIPIVMPDAKPEFIPTQIPETKPIYIK